MRAGHGNKGAIGGKPALMAAQRMRDKRGRHQIGMNGLSPGHARTGQGISSKTHLKDTPPTNLR
jgi:hypothetical protein